MALPVQPGPASHNQTPSSQTPSSQTPNHSKNSGKTYSVEGINLKAMPMGESDRLLTFLTPEQGLIRAIAPGARKQTSRLAGRSSIFVVNTLMLARGKSLDRIIQAETQYSFPGLAQDLGKLTAAQYLAELVLYQGLSDQPQADLYYLFTEHLERIEASDIKALGKEQVLARLSQALFHLLSLSGLAPQSHQCSLSRVPIEPLLHDPRWAVGFSVKAGGLVKISDAGQARGLRFNALEAAIFQRLAEPDLPNIGAILEEAAVGEDIRYRSPWTTIERALRQYVQYHFDRTIRSATLIDSYFSHPLPQS